MKRSKKEPGSHRLIDRLAMAPHYGMLRGVLATTFDLNPDFFETDFLPSLLGLGAWDDQRYSSRIAMEKALAQTDAVAIFMDARRYQGRPRSLRVELTPSTGNAGQTLHAKVTLIVHEAAVRLIVSSANLTESGYRLNREVALALTATKSNPSEGALIRSALEPMPLLFSSWWSKSAAKLHDLALKQLDQWLAPAPSDDEAFLWGGGSEPLFKSVLDRWPQGELILRITLVSPFWSEERAGGPIATLLHDLSSRKLRGDSLDLRLFTTAVHDTQTTYRPVLPESFRAFDGRALGVEAKAFAVEPRVDRDEVGGRDDILRERPLHAKIALFEGAKTAMAYLGSANFTASGWGLLPNPRRANIEAGVVIRRKIKDRAVLDALLPKTTGKAVPLTGAAEAWLALPAPAEQVAPWPAFIAMACLSPEPSNPDRLAFRLIVKPDAVDGAWSVKLPLDDRVLFEHKDGKAASEYRVSLDEESLRVLLRKQVVLVSFWARQDSVEFPINVEHELRSSLPLSPGDGRPGEKALLAYYQGRIEWGDLFPPDSEEGESATEGALSAISSEVDTSNIQSYQIREFVEALQGIRDDLLACPVSEGAMRLALLGPVSPVALGKEVLRAVREKKRTAVAAGFQLLELLACLRESKNEAEVNEGLRKTWDNQVHQASTEIERLLGELKQYDSEALEHFSFKAYERAARAQGGGR